MPPTASAAAICQPGPLTVAEFLAADSRCYVTADVSVVGWWDAKRDDDAYSMTALSRVLRGSIPIGLANGGDPTQFVLVNAEQLTPPGDWPDGARWVTVTGRRSPDNSAACYRDPGGDLWAAPRCPSYLVATSVVESAPPPTALVDCLVIPAGEEGSYVEVETFTGYPPACFGTSDWTLRGWFDVRDVTVEGGPPWRIVPAWLWDPPSGSWTVLSGDFNPISSSALNVYFDPARKLDASRTNRWVLLTGHYGDSKAQACRFTYTAGYDPALDGPPIPDSSARRTCEAHFVVTWIKDATP